MQDPCPHQGDDGIREPRRMPRGNGAYRLARGPGITDHGEIGKAWQPEKPIAYLDDVVGYEVPIDDWGEYSVIHSSGKILTSR